MFVHWYAVATFGQIHTVVADRCINIVAAMKNVLSLPFFVGGGGHGLYLLLNR